MRYFFDIVSIVRYYDFVIFHSRHNTLILRSCFMCFQEQWKYYLSSIDVDIIG